jgi:hypothetical protein
MKTKENYFDPMFCGTDTYWKHPLGFVYTDSMKDFCRKHKAYWILDIIGSYMPQFKKYDFLVLTFDVVDKTCTFYAKEDTYQPHIVEQFFEITDMDVSIKLYLERCDDQSVVLFPSDH